MKDPNDKTTRDLIDKPRRGRPPTGKAKSQAQIQREYRQRKKDAPPQPAPLGDRARLLLVWGGLLDLAETLEGDQRKIAFDLADLIAPVP